MPHVIRDRDPARSTAGFVYLLSNRCMLGVRKVGMTERSPHRRAYELSMASGVPTPFEIDIYVEVNNASQVERHLHEHFAQLRISEQREFFSITPLEFYDYIFELAPAGSAPDVLSSWMSEEVEQAFWQRVKEQRNSRTPTVIASNPESGK